MENRYNTIIDLRSNQIHNKKKRRKSNWQNAEWWNEKWEKRVAEREMRVAKGREGHWKTRSNSKKDAISIIRKKVSSKFDQIKNVKHWDKGLQLEMNFEEKLNCIFLEDFVYSSLISTWKCRCYGKRLKKRFA